MKIAEVREKLAKYSNKELRIIIAELYKAIPKAIKEEQGIDALINNPLDADKTGKKRKKASPALDIESIKFETEQFIENAYEQNYFAPNSVIHKKDRPKWRFIAKRLFKELTLAASVEENIPLASELLEKLYVLLCYSCEYVLFSAYDSFESTGIEQKEFFHRVLLLKSQHEKKPDFVRNAISIMINNGLNRYTLYSTLMDVIIDFVKTPDLKEMAITTCDELLLELKSDHTTKRNSDTFTYEQEEKIQNLAEMAFLCYAQLHEYEKAIDHFKKNYVETDKEIFLYILLKLLFSLNQKDYWIREYEVALKEGVQPRENLRKMYRFIQENGKLPDYIL